MGKCERVLCVKLDTNVMLWCVLGHTHVQPRLISVPDPILEFQVGVKKHERNLGRNASIRSGAFRRAGGRSRGFVDCLQVCTNSLPILPNTIPVLYSRP